MEDNRTKIILYRTDDGRANVALFARDGSVWLDQGQLAELFDTSRQNISLHIANILKEKRVKCKLSCQGILDNCPRWKEV